MRMEGRTGNLVQCKSDNGSSRTSVLQVTVGAGGVVQLPVPMPQVVEAA